MSGCTAKTKYGAPRRPTNSGYPSANEAAHILRDGNVRGGPMLTAADVERAYKIYGVHPEYVQGKLTNKVVGRPQVDLSL